MRYLNYVGIFSYLLIIQTAYANIYEWEYIDPSDPSQGKRESTILVPSGAGFVAAPGVQFFGNFNKAYLVGADLSKASLGHSGFDDADFSHANLTNVWFSMASVKRANFSYANLANTDLSFLNANGANFSYANLRGVRMNNSGMPNAILVGADITGFVSYFGMPFTREQFYSTHNYQVKDLTGINLSYAIDNRSIDGWNFSGQNLSGH